MGDGCVPSAIPLRAVTCRQLVPIFASEPIQVVYNAAIAQREFTGELLVSAKPRAVHIDKPVVSLFQAEHGYIGDGAHGQMSQLLLLDSRAGFQVDRRITSSSDIPSARNLSITFSMSFMPAFMLPMCRSVEIESGQKPLFTRGTAIPQLKLPPP
jgi:hypothetical protein